jgi:hypothetical protein
MLSKYRAAKPGVRYSKPFTERPLEKLSTDLFALGRKWCTLVAGFLTRQMTCCRHLRYARYMDRRRNTPILTVAHCGELLQEMMKIPHFILIHYNRLAFGLIFLILLFNPSYNLQLVQCYKTMEDTNSIRYYLENIKKWNVK